MLYANVGTTRNVVALDATAAKFFGCFVTTKTRFDEAQEGAAAGLLTIAMERKLESLISPQDTNLLDPETGIPDPTGRMA